MSRRKSTRVEEIPELEEDEGAKNEASMASPPALPRREGADSPKDVANIQIEI